MSNHQLRHQPAVYKPNIPGWVWRWCLLIRVGIEVLFDASHILRAYIIFQDTLKSLSGFCLYYTDNIFLQSNPYTVSFQSNKLYYCRYYYKDGIKGSYEITGPKTN